MPDPQKPHMPREHFRYLRMILMVTVGLVIGLGCGTLIRTW